MHSIADRRQQFRSLHESGCFVIPNPWDVGVARYLEHVGFKALATTSGGFAFSKGLPDGAVPRDAMLEHVHEIVAATDLPVSADFHSGYGDDPDDVYESVKLCVATGVAGLSIEDSTGRPDHSQYPIEVAVDRLAAARAAIDECGGDVLLVGRAENYFVGNRDLNDTVARIQRYSTAGADCLYAPGVRTREEIVAVVEAAAPKPINVVVANAAMTVDEYAALGVRRISLRGLLAMTAWATIMEAMSRLVHEGSFEGLVPARKAFHLNEIFAT